MKNKVTIHTHLTGGLQNPIDFDLAKKLLDERQVVALPTETVYGLAANAKSSEAIKRIYEAKGRPSHNPLIVHVSRNYGNLQALVKDGLILLENENEKRWEVAQRLMDKFWPGALTIVFPKGPALPSEVSGGLSTIGLRMPAHPIFLELLDRLTYPLAAPSANRSNHISPTNASHVYKDLNGRIPLIIDGGETLIGLESTIVNIKGDGQVTILRQGGIPQEDILSVVNSVSKYEIEDQSAPLAPGRLKIHYAPKTPLFLVYGPDDIKAIEPLKPLNRPITLGILLMQGEARTPKSWPIPKNVEKIKVWSLQDNGSGQEAAKSLYKTLREMDDSEADLLLVQMPANLTQGLWPAISDRLLRASAKTGSKN